MLENQEPNLAKLPPGVERLIKMTILSPLCKDISSPIMKQVAFLIIPLFVDSSVDYKKQIYFEVSLTSLKNIVLHFLVSKTNF